MCKMDRFDKATYEQMPWTHLKGAKKPKYEYISKLKSIPLGNRDPCYSEYYELQVYLDLLEDLPPGRMLDAGTGVGTLAYIFRKLGWNVIACDIDETYYKGGHFLKLDLNQTLPFKDETFDAVVCKHVIEHLENPYHILREFYRVLKKEGILVFSTPNITSISSRLLFMRTGNLLYFENRWSTHKTPLHYAQIRYILLECGFSKIEFYTNRYVLYNMKQKVSGRKRRFIVPLLKLICNDKAPKACKYGVSLITKAIKSTK